MMTRLQMLVGILAEECNEVAKLCSKVQRFGMDNHHPDYAQTNADALRGELNDLLGVAFMLNDEFSLGFYIDRDLLEAKKRKVNKFAELSIELGQVQP